MTKTIAFLWVVMTASAAWAQAVGDALICPPEAEQLDRFRYLRALSLDLRGTLPTPEEVAALEAEDDVPEAWIDSWLDSDAFAEQAVRRHRALLWNNIENITLLNAGTGLTFDRTNQVYWRRTPAMAYRGDTVPCADRPATFRPDGSIITQADPELEDVQREGWVEVSPYWAPDTTLRVCAFDAQTNQTTLEGLACNSNAAQRDPECGCGEDLRWCTSGATHRAVNRGMVEALEKVVFDIIRSDRPYTDIFSSRQAYINGPMAFFYRHHLKLGRLTFEPSAVPEQLVPDLPFTATDTWVPVELPDYHAGILTRPAFLLRFQTNRARANRFFNAFLCQPFQPPSAGLPVGGAPHPDLQLRDGCKYCHALLEPAAAHWGRWSENGMGFLSPEAFPREREDCMNCALRGQNCTTECRTQYLTRAASPEEEPYLGQLKSYTFRRDDHLNNVEQGPRLIAFTAFTDDRLPRCVSSNLAEWLLGRTLNADDDADWIADLGNELVATNYSYRQLVKAIVTSERYRRVR